MSLTKYYLKHTKKAYTFTVKQIKYMPFIY